MSSFKVDATAAGELALIFALYAMFLGTRIAGPALSDAPHGVQNFTHAVVLCVTRGCDSASTSAST